MRLATDWFRSKTLWGVTVPAIIAAVGAYATGQLTWWQALAAIAAALAPSTLRDTMAQSRPELARVESEGQYECDPWMESVSPSVPWTVQDMDVPTNDDAETIDTVRERFERLENLLAQEFDILNSRIATSLQVMAQQSERVLSVAEQVADQAAALNAGVR